LALPLAADGGQTFYTGLHSSLETIDAAIAKCNWAAATDPGVGDDSADGYVVGSWWWNTTGHRLWQCEDESAGAAVWRQIWPSLAADMDLTAYVPKSNWAAATDPGVGDDSADGYVPGSFWFNSTAHYLWVCEDNSAGAAVWRQIWPALLADQALAADWDAGSYKIKALQFESDIATGGGAPLVVASAAKVTNLQADSIDGNHMEAVTTKGDLLVGSGAGDLDRFGVGANGKTILADSAQACGFSWAELMTEGVYRQLIINGAFQVNQRARAAYTAATSPANSDDTYLLDQWVLLSDGNDIVDVSPEASVVPTGGASALKLEVETANKKFGIIQFVENKDALKYKGMVASLQFKAYTVTGKVIRNLRAAVLSWASTADTITSDVVSAWENEGTNPTLVANWTAENVAANCALVADTWTTYQIENIAIDTANMTNLAVFIWCDDADAAVDDLVYISQIQLNQGPVCTPYQPRCFEDELNRCKKYWQKSYNYGTAPGTVNAPGYAMLGMVMNTVWITCISVAAPAMRPITYIMTYHFDGTANAVGQGVGDTKVTDVIYDNYGNRGCRNVRNESAPFTAGQFINAHWVFSSEL
jgi:hypothetical protein